MASITSNSSDITFNSTINGDFGLSLTAGGSVVFNGAVGNIDPLTDLSFSFTGTSAHAINIGANITMSGDNELTFSAPVNLLNSSTITSFAAPNLGATIQFSSTVDGTGTSSILQLNAGTGDVIFGGKVGHQTPLANLIFSSAARIYIGNDINVTGVNPLVFNTYVILTGNSNITFADPQTGVDILFNKTIDGTTAGCEALTLDAGSGTVTLEGLIGNATPLTSMAVGSTTGITIPSRIVAGSVSGGGTLNMIGPVVLVSDTILDTTGVEAYPTGRPIYFSTTISNGAGTTAYSLKLIAGNTSGTTAGGRIMFEGPVGSPLSPLKELNCSSCGIIYIADNITVTGAYPLKFPCRVILTGTSTFTTTNNTIQFESTLNGTFPAQPLTLAAGSSGTIAFGGAWAPSIPLPISALSVRDLFPSAPISR